MIKPTIGRVLWYHSAMEHEQPLAVMVAFVHSDTEVNLGGFHANGRPFNATNVLLWQGEGERPTGEYAEWMPYQQGQAAKTEQLEKQLTEQKPPAPIGTPVQPVATTPIGVHVNPPTIHSQVDKK